MFKAGVLRGAGMEETARAYNGLGFNLLGHCRQSLPKVNYFLSPAGLAFALSMVQNGAQGETLSQIMATLQVGNIPLPQLNEANKALLDHLSKLDPKIKLEIANSIWIDKWSVKMPKGGVIGMNVPLTLQPTRIEEEFLAVNQRDYNALVTSADLHDTATLKRINDWVSDRTHGKIQSILQPPLDPLLRLVLLDAIYFKGDWVLPFATNLTRDLPFTLADGTSIPHPRMSHTGRYAYTEGDGFQAVELPYAGGQISMFVFLPKGSLEEFLKKFTVADFESSLSQMRSSKGTVELPRFKLENEYDLTHVLPSMGMPLAFTDGANFNGISDEPLHIGFVKQKTYLDVNEQGTEAAAVTGIGVKAMAMMREPPPFRFVVDRPFFMAIREKQTGLILFLGAISDPRG